MKKTVSLLLAVLIAAVAMCTFAMTAFADETTTTTTASNDDPVDVRQTTTTTTAATTTTTKATTTTTAATTTTTTAPTTVTTTESTAPTTTEPTTEKTHVYDPSNPAYEDQVDENKPTTTTTTKKATTTKAPAKVDTYIPSTGSEVVVPAIALLALAAGTVAVIKTKKED